MPVQDMAMEMIDLAHPVPEKNWNPIKLDSCGLVPWSVTST